MDDAAPRSRRWIDRHFRWRGREGSRLEGFSDAVFAIVLALLFLRAVPPEDFDDLEAAMKGLVPFAACFAIIAWVWILHWLWSRRYDLRDGWSTFGNLVLLFLLLFYAYPLKFLFTLLTILLFGPIGELTAERILVGFDGSGDATRLFVFYGVGYGAIFAVFALLHARALQRQQSLQLDRVERFLTRSAIVQASLNTGVAMLSIVLAALGVGLRAGIPGWVYAGIGPLMALHGTWEQRQLRRLGV